MVLMMNSSLSGYRVLDLTDEKGAFCSRLLADMGADVISVEKAQTAPSRSPFLAADNFGKRSITLNLESQRGQVIFRQLVETADIIVESYRPGYLAALALDYPQLDAINPRLIMASVTDFGQSGDYRDYKSCDMVNSALGGAMFVSGEPGMPPLQPYGNQSYHSAGLFAATGILLALWHRHTSGRGQYIDVSAQESVAATLDHVLVRYFYEGTVAKRQGSLYWNNAFRIFPGRDGDILLTLFYQWETLVEWLAAEGMAGDLADKKWQDKEQRLKHVEHVIAVLERWTRSHTVAELVEKGQAMRFPWAPVNSVAGLLTNPQLRERSFWLQVENPLSVMQAQFPGAPCRLSRSPWQVGSRVPRPGEHNAEVYQKELGLSAGEIEALARDGII